MKEVDDFLDAVLVPMLEDAAAHPYDPQGDLSDGAGGTAAAPADAAGPRHPAVHRPGFLARLLSGGRRALRDAARAPATSPSRAPTPLQWDTDSTEEGPTGEHIVRACLALQRRLRHARGRRVPGPRPPRLRGTRPLLHRGGHHLGELRHRARRL